MRWADPADPASFEAKIDRRTKAIFIESLANPGGTFVDIAAIAEVARKHDLPLIVDNTMATPYLLRPLEHGADIVVHSLTKFIGGHGNSMGGVIVDGGTFDWSKSGKYPMLSEPRPEYAGVVLHQTFGNIAFAIAARVLGLRDFGPAISPFNAFMLVTGAETLPLRMQRHCDNALAVAKWLKTYDKISWVNYAGLEDDPNHALQQRYSPKGAGAVFTFGLKGGYEAGKRFVEGLEMFSHLANIGDTRSLVIHPASTTHRQLTPEQQVAAGAGPDVVRLSVGIEDVSDIIADLEQSLAKL
ncbi:L-methionine gamma-lyase [compost metagenome]